MEEGISLGRWLMFTGSKGVWRTPGIAVTCGKELEHLCDRARRRDVEEEVNNNCCFEFETVPPWRAPGRPPAGGVCPMQPTLKRPLNSDYITEAQAQ